ncbi:MAG: transcriptional regulator [Gammaproteobacteria bacterium]|nr:MAG: transcriptional regulator [Gammaproteobacteria bacterium]
MEINATKVKEYRTKLGWTQQTLADACDLSLRTIQRVERYGTASSETLMSLCAVFEITQKELIMLNQNSTTEESQRSSATWSIVSLIVSINLGIIVGALTMYMIMR